MFGYSIKQVGVAAGAGIALVVLGLLIGNDPTESQVPFSSLPAVTSPTPQAELKLVPPETPQTLPPPQEEALKVTFVVDGDTVELSTGQRMRLIGIDAPENGSPYFGKARDKLIELVLNKEVRVEKDVTETDRYGRLSRYVYIGETFVNREMVRSGYAASYKYPPDVKYQDQFVATEQDSKTAGSGLWEGGRRK